MSFVQRAVTIGARLAWTGIVRNFSDTESLGYSVENQKGSIGNFVKGIASTAYKATVRNIKNNITSLKMFYVEDLKKQLLASNMYSRLNSIEWSDTRLWEIRIDGLPKPFQGFAPISQASLSAIDLRLETMQVGNTCWQYIAGQGTREITVDIQDDVTGAMEEFLYQWMDEVSGGKVTGVTPIEKAGKIIKFRKLSRGMLVTSEVSLYCVPQGRLIIDNNQSSRNVRTISISLAILGIKRSRTTVTNISRDFSQLTATATANLIRRNKLGSVVRSVLARF